MSLQIIRQDITKIKCDAIVNSTNTKLCPSGIGVDASIHKAAGPELLRECQKIGNIEIGKAAYTKAYRLPCKYVIHTAGPMWLGGNNDELAKLKDCYRNSLDVAKTLECESVALPLISSGVLGVPKDKVLKVAIDEINAFLLNNEMLVILAIFDKSSYEIGEDLSSSINEYIGHNLLAMDSCAEEKIREDSAGLNRKGRRLQPFPNLRSSMAMCEQPLLGKSVKPQSIEDIIEGLDESFSKKLFMLIDSKGMTDVECYKKANVSRQTWHKIISDPKYRPSKNTVISLAIALKLSYEQTDSLLESVGYALSSSIIFDVIIKYFLVNEKYDIFEIDSTLLKYDQVTLGSST